MKLPGRFLAGAAVALAAAVITGQPEFIVPALLLGGASAVTRRASREKRLSETLAEMEKRLNVTEGELEAASGELSQLKVEREFDRQLLRVPPQDHS